MASTDLALTDDAGLSARQVQALEQLIALNAEPAVADADGKIQWTSDPKIRALQMVFEGRLGGPREGAGRPRAPRAAEFISEKMREEPRLKKMVKAIDRALSKDAGARANLDAIKLAVDLENQERKLQLAEEVHDGNVGNTKDELVDALFQIVQAPEVAKVIEGDATEITDAEVIENGNVANVERETDSSATSRNGNNGGSPRRNGRGTVTGNGNKATNPLRKAALRRAANGR
jgi:hypothetical protein